MAKKVRRAAIYCRISQDREGRELGVERQRKDCEELARSLGWPVAESDVVIENDRGASAKSREPRPKYNALMPASRRARSTD